MWNHVSLAFMGGQRWDKHHSGQANKWTVCYRVIDVPCVLFLISCFLCPMLRSSVIHSRSVYFSVVVKLPGVQLLLFSQPIGERLIDVCECEYLVNGIKLPASQKLSCGPFGSDRCWLSSTAPGLQMQFIDCFHPLPETHGKIRNRLFYRGTQKPVPPHRHTHT